MSLKVIEVITDAAHMDTVIGIAQQQEVLEHWLGPDCGEARGSVRLLVRPEKRQAVLDALQSALGGDGTSRVLIQPVEAVWPQPEEVEEEERRSTTQTTREELYGQVERNAKLDNTFLLLVFLSTIVAAIGLIRDNVAVVIGAMVIAPLLGPNIALALGAALGDRTLMWRALTTNLAGLALAFALAWVIGYLWPMPLLELSHELAARTDVGMDGVALALASGAAAVLSLTTGLSAVLVGVMVAVALLPPAASAGLLLGSGHVQAAAGAGLLLGVNVVCVNLAAKVVLLVKGVRPRTWLEKIKARQSMTAYILFWVVSLAILLGAIYLRHQVLAL